jgi:hypothetical protein
MPPGPLHVVPGISPTHGILSFAYIGVCVLILAPAFFVPNLKLLGALLVAGIVLNAATHMLTIAPMNSAAQRLGPVLYRAYVPVISGLMLGFGMYFLAVLAMRGWEYRHVPAICIAALGAFWLTLTPAVITSNYSSRYSALAVPFLLFLTARFAAPTYWRALRLALGIALGALSLWTYYQTPGWTLPWKHVLR